MSSISFKMDKEINFNVCAVLPSGGNGLRMGISRPKQYCNIFGRPLLSYTLEAFEKISWIKTVIVTVSSEWKPFVLNMISKYGHDKTVVTIGSDSRHKSIYEGIKQISESVSDPDVVIIHDAVRPFVPEHVAKDVVLAAKDFGASGIIVPLISTVIAVDQDGFLDHSLERIKYKASEMPQAFQYKIIKEAYDKCSEYDFEFGTECLHLAQHYTGCKVKLIDCTNVDNIWKVTKMKDLFAMEGVLLKKYHHTVLYNSLLNSEAPIIMNDIFEHLKSIGTLEKVDYIEKNEFLPKTMTDLIIYCTSDDLILENIINNVSNNMIVICSSDDSITITKSQFESKVNSLPKVSLESSLYGILISDSRNKELSSKISELCNHLLRHKISALDRQVFVL